MGLVLYRRKLSSSLGQTGREHVRIKFSYVFSGWAGGAAPLSPHVDVDVSAGAARTNELIEAAIRKKTYLVDNAAQRSQMQGITESRALSLLLKFAFGFAVDLGRERIDDDCFKRARALVDYRAQAMRYLNPIEAETRQGLLQQRMVGLL